MEDEMAAESNSAVTGEDDGTEETAEDKTAAEETSEHEAVEEGDSR